MATRIDTNPIELRDAPGPAPFVETLGALHSVLSSSLLGIAPAFSQMLQPAVAHSALVIFTEDCTGRPQKKAGDAVIIDHVTIDELDAVRRSLPAQRSTVWGEERELAAASRPVAVFGASTGALLVLTDPRLAPGTTAADLLPTIAALWELVALSIRHQVAAAPPAYLLDSRAASAERASAIAELTDDHSTTLESLLAVLRSTTTSDEAARQITADLAAGAMVRLRAVSDRDRTLTEEPVAKAFERLRDDLQPLMRFGKLDVQFVEPPIDGRALPGEVAHAGRAIVRGAVLALIEQVDVSRVRVQWNCDGSNLLINIRDDGPGDLTPDVSSVRQLSARVSALEGDLRIEATPGWGSEIAVMLPLDAPSVPLVTADGWGLTAREHEVLELVATGARNRAIASALTISENTVKFHVASLLRKVGAATRAELAALTR
ncbi:LuxR C-terminal-related transcriptional regulator [Glaciihabitans sp. dw_435]|uniref:helix-turn-helix transcriptional regulator n=1 Tax=Glaciihabitans sp. dw_435 TaxID=2720081 RepID=UPI001BD573C9|nr:LuxR C-terminal-related transcriptional regulator [Glaciihabitans sp. dw_435]